jgi:hypothetical protein
MVQGMIQTGTAAPAIDTLGEYPIACHGRLESRLLTLRTLCPIV